MSNPMQWPKRLWMDEGSSAPWFVKPASSAVAYVRADQELDASRRTGNLTEADYDRAIGIIVRTKRASTSFLQREMGLAYNAAAKLMERAEADGFVSRPDAVGKRHVAADPSEAAADNRLIVGFMLDCNATGLASAAENLVRGIKAEAARRKAAQERQQ